MCRKQNRGAIHQRTLRLGRLWLIWWLIPSQKFIGHYKIPRCWAVLWIGRLEIRWNAKGWTEYVEDDDE